MHISRMSLALGSQGSGFSPRSLFSAGQVGSFIDPTLARLSQTSDGLTPVTAAGQVVEYVGDFSGNGNHFTNATSSITYEVDSNGVGYLNLPGDVNSWLASPSIDFSAASALTVFAFFRKTTDATVAILAELGVNAAITNGSFFLAAPLNGGVANVSFVSRGTAAGTATATALAAPISIVATGQGNIAGDNATLRVNGSVAATAATEQGTGFYQNAPIYLGRRTGTTLPFTGRLYGFGIVGGTVPAGKVSQTEAWGNARIKAY